MAITIKYKADTRAAERNISRLERGVESSARTARRTGTAFSRLGPLIAGAFSIVAVSRFSSAMVTASDSVTNISNQLRSAGVGTSDIGNNLRAVADLAESTRASVAATGGLYARILRSTRELGLSQREALDVTRTFQQTLALSGASTQEAAAASLQFGQALASGRLAGDELRSILENNSFFAQRVAEQLGVGVGALRDMGAAGDLTSETLARIALEIAPGINEEFSQLAPTFGQLATVINNQVLEALSAIGSSILGSVGNVEILATAIGEGLGDAIRLLVRSVSSSIAIIISSYQSALTTISFFWTALTTGAESVFLAFHNFGASFLSVFTSAFSGAINFLINRVNDLINLLNATTSQLSRLPGVGIGEIPDIEQVSIGEGIRERLQASQTSNRQRRAELATEREDGLMQLSETFREGIDRIFDAATRDFGTSAFSESGEVSDMAPPVTPSVPEPVAASVNVGETIEEQLDQASEVVDRSAMRFSRRLRDSLAEGLESGDYSSLRQVLLSRLSQAFDPDGALEQGIGAIFDSLAGVIGNLFNNLSGTIGNLFSSLNLGGGFLGGLGGLFSGLLAFERGGVVPGNPGSAVPIIAHAGEVVLNRGQQNRLLNGNAGQTINQTINVTGDVTAATRRAVADMSRDIAANTRQEFIESGVLA